MTEVDPNFRIEPCPENLTENRLSATRHSATLDLPVIMSSLRDMPAGGQQLKWIEER